MPRCPVAIVRKFHYAVKLVKLTVSCAISNFEVLCGILDAFFQALASSGKYGCNMVQDEQIMET